MMHQTKVRGALRFFGHPGSIAITNRADHATRSAQCQDQYYGEMPWAREAAWSVWFEASAR